MDEMEKIINEELKNIISNATIFAGSSDSYFDN